MGQASYVLLMVPLFILLAWIVWVVGDPSLYELNRKDLGDSLAF